MSPSRDSRAGTSPPMERFRWVRLRPLEPGETRPALEVFAGLGSRSRELRFLAATPRVKGTLLTWLAADGHDHVALVAESGGGRAVGLAHFVRDPENHESAEVAVAVVDDWQNKGVGTLLASALVERAQQVGVRRFTVTMRPDNEGAIRLLHRISHDPERLSIDRDVAEFAVALA